MKTKQQITVNLEGGDMCQKCEICNEYATKLILKIKEELRKENIPVIKKYTRKVMVCQECNNSDKNEVKNDV